ncbi:unnamed protein product [Cuscuta campestris]|uniref:Uncharacterized protein n=1 Tax=Cuscuta campestris TaxID=132261 RepID=A0A484LKF4_9ASTE|nr:unnamed protein product [Cuscuta campestris]
MAGRGDDSDSDAPEEFTAVQGIEKNEEIIKAERDSKARVVREAKERRRKWAEKLTPRPKQNKKAAKDETESKPHSPEESEGITTGGGMLPDSIVQMLVSREKKVFSSDSEEEEPKKSTGSKKKRPKKSGLKPVIIKEIPPPPCLDRSIDFLKKRKMHVQRSSAVLNNSNQALRFLTSTGLLSGH